MDQCVCLPCVALSCFTRCICWRYHGWRYYRLRSSHRPFFQLRRGGRLGVLTDRLPFQFSVEWVLRPVSLCLYVRACVEEGFLVLCAAISSRRTNIGCLLLLVSAPRCMGVCFHVMVENILFFVQCDIGSSNTENINLLWTRNVKIWGLLNRCRELWSHYLSLCPHFMRLSIYSIFYRNLDLVYIFS